MIMAGDFNLYLNASRKISEWNSLWTKQIEILHLTDMIHGLSKICGKSSEGSVIAFIPNSSMLLIYQSTLNCILDPIIPLLIFVQMNLWNFVNNHSEDGSPSWPTHVSLKFISTIFKNYLTSLSNVSLRARSNCCVVSRS